MSNSISTAALVAELSALRGVAAMHCVKIAAAATPMDDAQLAFEQVYGVHPATWRGRSALLQAWQAADAAYDALTQDDGYYWTCSRIRDLEIMVEGSNVGQLRLMTGNSKIAGCDVDVWGLGGMPRTHRAVAAFVLATLAL